MKKLLCYLFGHGNAINLFRHVTRNYESVTLPSESTGWKCLRCGVTWAEGWDA